jgi:DNA-binding transcriptional LysR family regulator
MFPVFETRQLNAVIALAESRSYTRAAERLHITQSGFSKQITEIEDRLGFRLFARDGKRIADLTDAGRVFVEHARLSILHNQRAIQLARAAHEGAEHFLRIGHSPYADRRWLSALLATRLPLYPKLECRLSSDFMPELVGSILANAFDLALIMAPPAEEQVTAVTFSREPLYAVLRESHAASRKGQLRLKDLAEDPWILFRERVNPVIHFAVMNLAEQEAIPPRQVHHVLTPQEGIDDVADDLGVAFMPRAAALRYRAAGMIAQPLWDQSLWFDICLVMRTDNDSRMTNQFARAFLRQSRSLNTTPGQLEFPVAG